MSEEREEHIDDKYLWDGSGQPDPQIQHIERALARFRHSGSAPLLPAISASTLHLSWWDEIAHIPWLPRFAAALLVLAAVGFGLWISRSPSSSPNNPHYGWTVELIAPSDSPNNATETKKTSRLELGETLETDARSRANIAVAEIGRLEVEPMTRLRLLQAGTGRKRIALERGTIHVTIWAPPGQFVVDTPSAIAIDLGCMYTLHIDDAGNGILRTTLGWVGFHRNGRESFIPAGAACPTNVQTGPGIPYFEDSSEAFRSALTQLDWAAQDPLTRETALGTVLREARDRDALTLWHLLARVNNADRPRVYDRLAALVPPPAGVTRDGVLRLDTNMLDSWWNALDLGDISLWRHWEQSWTGHEGQPR